MNVETVLIIHVHQRCFDVDIWLRLKIKPTCVYRCCFNVDKTTLRQRWQNCLVSTPITQRFFSVAICLKIKIESTHVYWRCFKVDKTMLEQRWQICVVSTLMIQCWFNVNIWLKIKVKSMYIHQRCFNVNNIQALLILFAALIFNGKWVNNKIELWFKTQKHIILFWKKLVKRHKTEIKL